MAAKAFRRGASWEKPAVRRPWWKLGAGAANGECHCPVAHRNVCGHAGEGGALDCKGCHLAELVRILRVLVAGRLHQSFRRRRVDERRGDRGDVYVLHTLRHRRNEARNRREAAGETGAHPLDNFSHHCLLEGIELRRPSKPLGKERQGGEELLPFAVQDVNVVLGEVLQPGDARLQVSCGRIELSHVLLVRLGGLGAANACQESHVLRWDARQAADGLLHSGHVSLLAKSIVEDRGGDFRRRRGPAIPDGLGRFPCRNDEPAEQLFDPGKVALRDLGENRGASRRDARELLVCVRDVRMMRQLHARWG
eukprot:1834054-Pyramimonas_sp.AAC.1